MDHPQKNVYKPRQYLVNCTSALGVNLKKHKMITPPGNTITFRRFEPLDSSPVSYPYAVVDHIEYLSGFSAPGLKISLVDCLKNRLNYRLKNLIAQIKNIYKPETLMSDVNEQLDKILLKMLGDLEQKPACNTPKIDCTDELKKLLEIEYNNYSNAYINRTTLFDYINSEMESIVKCNEKITISKNNMHKICIKLGINYHQFLKNAKNKLGDDSDDE